jgi:hypothetical protein
MLINYLTTVLFFSAITVMSIRFIIDTFFAPADQIFAPTPDFSCDFAGSQYFNSTDFLYTPIERIPCDTPHLFINPGETPPATPP